MKRSGILTSWNPVKMCGVITCRDTNPVERYFLFGSRVVSGPEPSLNCPLLFEPDSRPTLPGKLPYALQVEVLGDSQ